MANETITSSAAGPSLPAKHVYAMAAMFLVAGLVIGYVLRGSQPTISSTQPALRAGQSSASVTASGGPASAPARAGQMPAGQTGAGHLHSLADMKMMADKQAAPILEKLKTDPNNSALLSQVGTVYHTTHQFKKAATYFDKAVKADPKNVGLRTKLAISLYRDGDVDGAIAQLNQALKYDSKDANALFNLGMIKWQGKQDSKGALAAWQLLLKTNPQLSADRKAAVQKLMADLLTTTGEQNRVQGVASNDRR